MEIARWSSCHGFIQQLMCPKKRREVDAAAGLRRTSAWSAAWAASPTT
jgi:hypothetical protein